MKKKKIYVQGWQVGKCPCHPFLNLPDPPMAKGQGRKVFLT